MVQQMNIYQKDTIDSRTPDSMCTCIQNYGPSNNRQLSKLPRRMSAVDSQIRRSHEATRITDQEYRRSSVLLRYTQLSEHILRGPVSLSLGILLEKSFYHCGDDVAGGDGVDADSVGTPFRGEVACELDHARFGSVVCGTDEALFGSDGVSGRCMAEEKGRMDVDVLYSRQYRSWTRSWQCCLRGPIGSFPLQPLVLS